MRSKQLSENLIEILSARKSSWRGGQTKEHIIYKVFPLKSQGLEVMCRGCSKWHYADGTHYEANWSSYMSYVKIGEEMKLQEYEIYMASVQICFGVETWLLSLAPATSKVRAPIVEML